MAWARLPEACAAIYAAAAAFAFHYDRNTGGSFINLSGMVAGIVTLPGSLLIELLTGKFDFRDNTQASIAILITAAIVYLLAAGLQRVIRA